MHRSLRKKPVVIYFSAQCIAYRATIIPYAFILFKGALRFLIVQFLLAALITQVITQVIAAPINGESFKKNTDTSAASIRWSEITLTYNKEFISKVNSYEPIPGCFPVTSPSSEKMIVRCKEYIKVIRPDSMAGLWQHEQNIHGYIDLCSKIEGSGHIKARITKRVPVVLNLPARVGSHVNSKLVTGLFIRHSTEVERYQFMENSSGQVTGISATSNHPFYVKSKKRFLPIRDISSEDRLMTKKGGQARLVTPEGNNESSASENQHKITRVYDLEVMHAHTYFAGEASLLVHNSCLTFTEKLQREIPDLVIDDEGRKQLNIVNRLDVNRAWAVFVKIKGDLIQSDVATILLAAEHTQKPVDIKAVEELLILRLQVAEDQVFSQAYSAGLNSLLSSFGELRPFESDQVRLSDILKRPGEALILRSAHTMGIVKVPDIRQASECYLFSQVYGNELIFRPYYKVPAAFLNEEDEFAVHCYVPLSVHC